MLPSPDNLLIISAVIPLALILFGLWRPIYAVLGYTLFVYWNVSHYFPFFEDKKAELILGILVFGRALLGSNKLNALSLTYDPINKYLYGFIAAMALSFTFSWDLERSWNNAVYLYIKVLFICIPLHLSISDIKDVKVFLYGWVIMYLYLCYEPLYNFIVGVGGRSHHYGEVFIGSVGLLAGHVAFANNMNQIIPLTAYMVFQAGSKKLKIFALISLCVFLSCLVISRSRAGVIGFIFFMMLFIYYSKNRLKMGLIIGVSSLMFILASGAIVDIFSQTAGRIDVENTEGRLVRIIHGIEMVRFGNITGVGPGCYIIASGFYFGHTMDAHNIYGELVGDLGIPGTLMWCLLIFHAYKNLSKARNAAREYLCESGRTLYFFSLGLMVSLFVRLFISLASHGLYSYYWYVIAILSIHVKKLSENIESNKMLPS